MRPVHVAKFGGTSVGSPERIRRVVELSMAVPETYRRVVVVSAFGGVTDRLLAAVDAAVGRTGEHTAILDAIRARHAEAVEALVAPGERTAVQRTLDALFGEVADLLHGIALLRECTPRFRDAIVSAGERASVPVVAAAFRALGHPAVGLDATAFVRTDDGFGEATVDAAETRRLVRSAVLDGVPEDAVAVVTGFVASTADGVTTTLGRSGSDYTATILAGALDAAECVIWTDVDGVLSADPRIVPEAFSLPSLSYEEASELAHFGAKVLHPRTMWPLVGAGIPLVTKNTLNPDHPGTRIGPAAPDGASAIRGVTAVRGVTLVRVEGAAVLEVPDLAARTFAPLAAAGLPVYLVAQASSEGSLGLAVRDADAERAVGLLRHALAREIERGDVRGISAESGAAVVAAVGSFVHDAPGLAGRMFQTLGRAHVNVRALAQGGGDHTVSAVVADADAPAALRALHEAFALKRLRAHLVVVGAGTLARRFLDLLAERSDALDAAGLRLSLVGLADSRRLAWDPAGMNPAEALVRLGDAPPADLDALSEAIATARLERLIVVDATPSAAVAARHARWLGAGVAVVTPNKAATAVPADVWRRALAASRAGEAPYLYESAVGAGLGVVARLRDLVRTGDTVHAVEAVLSGTVAFVMDRLRAGETFSSAVRAARAAGLTEPDVRDDLSGRDLARKLALLAREMGLDADPADAAVESLVPPALADAPPAAVLDRLAEADDAWAARVAAARAEGAELQLVGRLTADGAITAAVETVPAGSPLAGLRGSEVAVVFHTARAGDTPLVLRGPGAHLDVTAAVLLADAVRAAEAMR